MSNSIQRAALVLSVIGIFGLITLASLILEGRRHIAEIEEDVIIDAVAYCEGLCDGYNMMSNTKNVQTREDCLCTYLRRE